MAEFTPNPILQEIRDGFEGKVEMSEIESEVYYTNTRLGEEYIEDVDIQVLCLHLKSFVIGVVYQRSTYILVQDSTERITINFVSHGGVRVSSTYFNLDGYPCTFENPSSHDYPKGYFVDYLKFYVDKDREFKAENELRVVLQERNERVRDLIEKTWWNPHTMFGRMKQQILYNCSFEE